MYATTTPAVILNILLTSGQRLGRALAPREPGQGEQVSVDGKPYRVDRLGQRDSANTEWKDGGKTVVLSTLTIVVRPGDPLPPLELFTGAASAS